MIRIQRILGYSNGIRCLFLMVSWFICFALIFHCATPIPIPDIQGKPLTLPDTLKPFKTGPFRCIRYDPANPFVPLYSIELKSAVSSCGTVGLFRTGGYRTLYLDQVRISMNSPDPFGRIFTHTSQVTPNPWDVFQAGIGIFENRNVPLGVLGVSVEIDYGLPDLGHVLGIEIQRFECTIYQGQETLHIRSQFASWSAGQPEELLLRGHVMVSNSKTILEGNVLRWDIQENRFRTEKLCFVKNPVRKYVINDFKFDSTLKSL